MQETYWRKGQMLVWPKWKERERKEEWVGRCQMAAQFQEMLSQEERLSLSQSHLLEESLALMEWADFCIPSVLSHQFGDACGKCGVCANTGVGPGEQHFGPSVNDAPCSRIQAAHFHDCKNPPPSCLTDLLPPAIQGTASYSVVPGTFSSWEEGIVGQIIAPNTIVGWSLGTAGGSQLTFHSLS